MNIVISIFLISFLIIQVQSRKYETSDYDCDYDCDPEPKEEPKVVLSDVMSVILPTYGQHFKEGMCCLIEYSKYKNKSNLEIKINLFFQTST